MTGLPGCTIYPNLSLSYVVENLERRLSLDPKLSLDDASSKHNSCWKTLARFWPVHVGSGR